MKKKSISLILIMAMLLWTVPAAGAYGQSEKVSSKTNTRGPDAVEGQVVVLYEDGAVDTDAPQSKAEKKSVKRARKAKSFGSAMNEAAGNGGLKQANNTLGQQADILSDTLGSDYVIEDTVVIDPEENSKGSTETVVSTVSSDTYSAEELAEKLSANDNITAAEPNYYFHALSMPDWNDTYISEAWQNTDKGVNADAVWGDPALSGKGEPAVIAVMDTGIDYDHEDLADRMWTEPEGFKLKGFHGMDFVERDADPMDYNGHGTHCAGIIAAAANNGAGTVGVAGPSDKVQLMAARVLDEEGSGTFEDIIAAFYYLIRAKNAGANIKAVNCSFGASVTSEIFDKVIEKTGEAGILTIAASGNETFDNDQMPSAPANCKSEYVISVAALDDNGELASYSNYGTKSVDVAAPGSNILSTVSYDNYAPYLYDNERLNKTTEYYGEFGGAEIIEETDADGNVVQKVTPVSGTDYNGDPVTVGTFGESLMATNSKTGKATLDFVEGDDASFNVGNNRTTLRWKITGAEEDDTFVLIFPYEKMASSYADTYANMVFRTHTDSDWEAGALAFGDAIIHVDKNGDMTYRSMATDSFFGSVLPVSKDWNSIWQASGDPELLYPYSEIKGLSNNYTVDSVTETAETGTEATAKAEETDGYGLGFVYTALNDGDVYIDISSLAISKVKADTENFGRYDVYSGTSMATPVVTGAVGMIAAMDPDLSAAQLRDKLYETTRGGYSEYCSTGGAVDFSAYTHDAASAKPVIGSAVCDFENKTVELSVSNAGQKPEITAKFNLADKTKKISADDMTVKDGKIIISDKYGLIGSDVTFIINNTKSGLSGQRTFYLVKGLRDYDELFTMKAEVEEEEMEDWSARNGDEETDGGEGEEPSTFPSGLTYIKGADRFLLYDDNTIYKLTEEDGKYTVAEAGTTIREAVDAYAAEMAQEHSLWAMDDADSSSNAEGQEYYTVEMITAPVAAGNTVYTLVKVDLTDREAILTLGLDLGTGNWTVYYDSLTDFGSAPAELRFSDAYDMTLGAYNGKLYYFDGYDTDEEGRPLCNTRVYSCTPSADGSKWKRDADMPVPVTEGKVIGHGGNLYYFFGADSEYNIDYNIYKFDGTKWTKAGRLPSAVYKSGGDIGLMILFGLGGDDLSCAYGIDDAGIVFAGRSFDGAGDTFRFNTKTGKIENLGYSLWGDIADRSTDGTIAGGKLLVQYDTDGGEEVTAKTISLKTGYYKVKVKVKGKGKGTVTGAGSFPKGEKSHIVITPAKGSYIYRIKTKGLKPNLNKKYGKPTKASKKALETDFNGKSNATVKVHFGKISTKIKIKKVKTVKVGKRRLKAYTNGTIKGVKWKSSNKKYAKVNKNGTITFKKKGIGKTVKLTAISKENPKLRKTIKVKIKKK